MASSTYSYRGLYLLHFDYPYQHARHYMGYAKRDIVRYAKDVIAGRAMAPQALVEAALGAGTPMQVAATWPGWDRTDRRRMRRNGSLSRFCPICIAEGTNHK